MGAFEFTVIGLLWCIFNEQRGSKTAKYEHVLATALLFVGGALYGIEAVKLFNG